MLVIFEHLSLKQDQLTKQGQDLTDPNTDI